MKIEKFTVERIQGTPSGVYAVYTSERGNETWTGNFGFKKGDKVELHDYDGYYPRAIFINGVQTSDENDCKRYWETKEQRDTDHVSSLLKEKGIKHATYNP